VWIHQQRESAANGHVRYPASAGLIERSARFVNMGPMGAKRCAADGGRPVHRIASRSTLLIESKLAVTARLIIGVRESENPNAMAGSA
jgi:hypothetical protein